MRGSTGASGAVIEGTTYNVTGDVTLYAIWEDEPHTHAYSTEWSTDETNHWHECSVCHAKKDEAPHTYDNACDTTCNDCGKTREITHSYGEAWSNDETNHWHECSVCHTKKDEAAHIQGAEATETTAQTCTVCGYVIKAPLGHTHRPTIVKRVEPTCEKAGNIEHYKCSCGKLYYDAAATKEITNAAKIILSATGHTRGGDWKSSEIYHWHECAVCGERMDTAFHRAGAEATETTPQTCAVCRYVMKEALGHTHSFTEKNTDAKYLKSAATCKASAEYYYSSPAAKRERRLSSRVKSSLTISRRNGRITAKSIGTNVLFAEKRKRNPLIASNGRLTKRQPQQKQAQSTKNAQSAATKRTL